MADDARGRDSAVLLSDPPEDSLFRQVILRQIALVDNHQQTVSGARRRIRKCYAKADLYRHPGVAIGPGRATVWFAYRDGQGSPSMPSARWWRGASVASAKLDAAVVMWASPEFRTLVGLPPIARTRESVVDRVGPAMRDELSRMGRTLAAGSEIVGTIDLRLPWGDRQPVEFHARRTGVGPRGYAIRLRTVEDRDAAITRSAASIALRTASATERKSLLRRPAWQVMGRGDGAATDHDGRWALLVIAGIVRLFVHAGGSEPTLSYHGHGALLGSHIVPRDQSVAIGVEAVTPSVVVRISPQSVTDLLAANAGFAVAVLSEAQKLVGLTASSLAARSAARLPQRLAREIGLLAAMTPSADLVAVTEQQLADGVGSIRESVARTLKTFRQRGWIATTGRGVLILDSQALEELAKAAA